MGLSCFPAAARDANNVTAISARAMCWSFFILSANFELLDFGDELQVIGDAEGF